MTERFANETFRFKIPFELTSANEKTDELSLEFIFSVSLRFLTGQGTFVRIGMLKFWSDASQETLRCNEGK